ncbi:MAG TPA: hypothetical protein VHE35_17025 [Kofleriaceae bacterium]|nr:hypothetical protein [Kofleriaceae bacterium]
MSRLVDGLVAGGLVAGVVWYTCREIKKARAATRAGERLVAVVEARADANRPPAYAGPPAAAPVPTSPPVPRSSAPSTPPPALSRRFDDIFRQHGQGLPVAYLRALGQAESGLNPDSPKGLINVVSIALTDYNRRHPGASVAAAHLRNPVVSVTVAADILRTIIAGYRQQHGDVLNLQEDWRNPRFVELLTFSWNAGFSETAGVGRVVRYIQGLPAAARPASITVDAIAAHAHAASASEYLSNPRKLAFAKRVAADFAREAERDRQTSPTSS